MESVLEDHDVVELCRPIDITLTTVCETAAVLYNLD